MLNLSSLEFALLMWAVYLCIPNINFNLPTAATCVASSYFMWQFPLLFTVHGRLRVFPFLLGLALESALSFCGFNHAKWPDASKKAIGYACEQIIPAMSAVRIDLGKYSAYGRARIARQVLLGTIPPGVVLQ